MVRDKCLFLDFNLEGEACKLAVHLPLCQRLNNFVVVHLMMALASDLDSPWAFPFSIKMSLALSILFYRGFVGFFFLV